MRVINILFNYKRNSRVQAVGGVEQCFIDYTRHFLETGHEVIAISKPNMAYKKNILSMDVEYHEINAMGYGDIISIIKIGIIIAKFNPDVIICHSGRALHMARLGSIFQNVPIIGVNHGHNAKKFLKADYIFTVNSYIGNKTIEIGYDKDKIFIVPNMLRIPDDFELSNYEWHDPIVIGTLSRLSREKRQNRMIEAIAVLKSRGLNVKLLIGGSGNIEDELKDLVKSLQLEKEVVFLGWVNDQKRFFDQIDIFCLSSIVESFGIVQLDAMMNKKPIVTTNTWGANDIFENEKDAIIISKENEEKMPELLANGIEKLINNRQFAEVIAKNAFKKFINNYSSIAVGKKINDIIEQIIKN